MKFSLETVIFFQNLAQEGGAIFISLGKNSNLILIFTKVYLMQNYANYGPQIRVVGYYLTIDMDQAKNDNKE